MEREGMASSRWFSMARRQVTKDRILREVTRSDVAAGKSVEISFRIFEMWNTQGCLPVVNDVWSLTGNYGTHLSKLVTYRTAGRAVEKFLLKANRYE